jgi:membrane-bound inhibitor of C-type lysozyme
MFCNHVLMKPMKITGRHLFLIGLCALSAARARETPKIQEVRNYQATFLCDGNQQMHVRFVPFKAELESQGVSVDMSQQLAADGYLYTDGSQSLRARGSEATWTDGKGAVHHCREGIAANPKSNISNRQ